MIIRLYVAASLATMICLPVATGQGGNYAAKELQTHFQKEAEAYEIRLGETELALRKNPLMHWQNPERNQELGATYVWESDGVPLVLASIFTYEWNDRVNCRHEMISLADAGFECQLHSEAVWTPSRAGLDWKTLDDVDAPASSAPRRLFQMRTIARQFSGEVLYRGRAPDKLKLIPTPLIRYQSPEQGILDGAIFSLAVGTDPEILIAIRAVRDDDGTATFKYAPTRANYHELILRRNEQQVWDAPLVIALEQTRANQQPWTLDPFFVFTPSRPLPDPGTIE